MPDGGSTIPYGLRAAPDVSIWMTELVGGRLVKFDPATEEFEIHALPTPYSGPRRLDIAPDGVVWVPEFTTNRLARFDPVTKRFTEYELPVPDALPYVARVASDGSVWVGTAGADLVSRFDPAQETFVLVPLPTTGSLIRHLDIDPRTGEVWGVTGDFPPRSPRIFRIRGPGAAVIPLAGVVWFGVGQDDPLESTESDIPAYMVQRAMTAPERGVLVVRGSTDDGSAGADHHNRSGERPTPLRTNTTPT